MSEFVQTGFACFSDEIHSIGDGVPSAFSPCVYSSKSMSDLRVGASTITLTSASPYQERFGIREAFSHVCRIVYPCFSSGCPGPDKTTQCDEFKHWRASVKLSRRKHSCPLSTTVVRGQRPSILLACHSSSASLSIRTNSSEERSPVISGAIPLRSLRLGSSSSSGSSSIVSTLTDFGKFDPAG